MILIQNSEELEQAMSIGIIGNIIEEVIHFRIVIKGK